MHFCDYLIREKFQQYEDLEAHSMYWLIVYFVWFLDFGIWVWAVLLVTLKCQTIGSVGVKQQEMQWEIDEFLWTWERCIESQADFFFMKRVIIWKLRLPGKQFKLLLLPKNGINTADKPAQVQGGLPRIRPLRPAEIALRPASSRIASRLQNKRYTPLYSGLTKIHNDKTKSLLNSIQILKKEKAAVETQSK